MDVAHLMIILSMLADGGMSAAFVNSDSLAACEQRAKTIKTILTTGGVEVRETVCVPSELAFERYSHGVPESAPRHAYLVEFENDTVQVAPIMDMVECESVVAHTAAPPSMRRLCVTSTQQLSEEADVSADMVEALEDEAAPVTPAAVK